MSSELQYQIALTLIDGVGSIMARHLISRLGSARAVFEASVKQLLAVEGVGRQIAAAVKSPLPLATAEREVEFVEKNRIGCYFLTDDSYPFRLRECYDAPMLLYYKGTGALGNARVVSVVGTRKPTDYGIDATHRLVNDLSRLCPDAIIVSGLAYGIDIAAHRSALQSGLQTVGVLAHGLDRIYPSVHRKTAVEMVKQGGLLTEFPSGTEPERYNFIRRNRIVAGLSDVTVVVESAPKGGALITAEIANSYSREVCAFPGRAIDAASRGCNRLITENKAALIEGADDLLKLMKWDLLSSKNSEAARSPTLFADLTDEERTVVESMKPGESYHIDELSFRSGFPIYLLPSIMHELEFKQAVRSLPGSSYRLV